MKNFTLLVIGLTCLLSASAIAQITLTTANTPTPGNQYPAGIDTTATWFSIGPAGPNQTWDFSQAAQHRVDTTFAVAPSATPYSGQFGSSTVALTQNNEEYLFFQNTTGAFIGTGIAGDFLDNGNNLDVQFNPTFDLYQFPTAYGNTFTGNYQATKTVDGSDVGQPLVDKVRLTITSTYFDTIDAWGTVITPVGQYATLRQHRVEQIRVRVETKAFLFPNYTPVSDDRDTTSTYIWLNDEVDGILATAGQNASGGNTLSYSKIPPAPIADFNYVNVSGGVFEFTDASLNSPTTWSWNFGDGSPTSSQQNPTHIYTANDTVYACLTVTNTSGTDLYCDSVRISNIQPNNPPIARNDTAATNSPAAVTITVTGNDIEPDGDPLTVATVTQPTNGAAVLNGNGTITYTPDASFVGQDSFTYSVCDDGSPAPVLCDTATVFIDVAPNPVFADFTTDLTQCRQFTAINASQNFTGLASWRYVELGGTDTSGFIGDTLTVTLENDTVSYVVCVSVVDAGSNLYTSCKTVAYTLPQACIIDGITEAGKVQVNLYPNPANGQVVVTTSAIGETLQVFNLIGAEVLTTQLTGSSQTIDISVLQPGLYVYQVAGTVGKLMVK